MTPDEIVREIARRSWSFGVAVLMQPTAAVSLDGSECGGYFTDADETPLLVVAQGCDQEDWLGTLLHEYSHLTQWAEKSPVWMTCDPLPSFHAWLAGDDIGRNVKKVMVATREVEADCERRTVRLLKELQAPIDVRRYTQQANCYIHAHNVMHKKRAWFHPDRRIKDAPEVYSLFNTEMDSDFSTTPKHLADAIATLLDT